MMLLTNKTLLPPVRPRLPAVLPLLEHETIAGGCYNWVVPGLAPGLDPLEGMPGSCGWQLAEPAAEEERFPNIAMT
jgi:hypothetical protein